VRLNQAQRDLISQQASYAFARVSLKQSWINLHTATGAILQR
jgi:outer membrane protein TolC